MNLVIRLSEDNIQELTGLPQDGKIQAWVGGTELRPCRRNLTLNPKYLQSHSSSLLSPSYLPLDH